MLEAYSKGCAVIAKRCAGIVVCIFVVCIVLFIVDVKDKRLPDLDASRYPTPNMSGSVVELGFINDPSEPPTIAPVAPQPVSQMVAAETVQPPLRIAPQASRPSVAPVAVVPPSLPSPVAATQDSPLDITSRPQLHLADAALQQSPSSQTAVCMVGYARTFRFKGVRDRLRKHVFNALGLNATLFALIWLDKSWLRKSQMINRAHVLEVLPSEIMLAHLELHKAALSKDLPHVNTKCKVDKYWYGNAYPKAYSVNVRTLMWIQSWMAQWGKLAKCFNLVKEFEAKQHAKFVYVLRIRPDMLFLTRIPPPSTILGEAAIAIPDGIGGSHGFNDHAVICKMRACPAYFLPPDDYLNCIGRFEKQFHYQLGHGIADPAKNRIKHERWKLKRTKSLVYTLVRGRSHRGDPVCLASCDRLSIHNLYSNFVRTCKEAEAKVCAGATGF